MIAQYLTLEYYGLDFVFIDYLGTLLGGFSSSTVYIIIGFSLISAYYMKTRLGLVASLMYMPAMAACSFAAYYFFWEHEIFNARHDVERVFSSMILGMVIALIVVIIINNVKEHLHQRSIRHIGKRQASNS